MKNAQLDPDTLLDHAKWCLLTQKAEAAPAEKMLMMLINRHKPGLFQFMPGIVQGTIYEFLRV